MSQTPPPKDKLVFTQKKEESAFLSRKKTRIHTEETESNWLVSYADMMTLLVGFFVILLSFSKVDATAFENIKKETTKVFGGEYKIPFEDLTNKIKDAIAQAKLDDQVRFKQTDAGIEVSFRGHLFFDSGSAELKPEAQALMEEIIPLVSEQAKDFGILIEGHTDNVPVVSKQFPSNWELSSVRACTVLRLFDGHGFPKKRLKAVGYSDTRPVLPNQDDQGVGIVANQAQNRRVVIKVLRQLEEEDDSS